MKSINQQLNIPLASTRLTNQIAYARTPFSFEPDLYVESWDSDILGAGNNVEFSMFVAGGGGLSVLTGQGLVSYPLCSGSYKDLCVKCKAEAQSKPKSGWLRDGKKNYASCMDRELKAIGSAPPTPSGQSETQNSTPSGGQKTGMSKGAKTALIIGGVLVVGIIGFFAIKKIRS